MARYSAWSLWRNAMSSQTRWQPAWNSPKPKSQYDVIIIGGGGHGLATAFYLAKVHGITKVAVLEKSWLGGGSVGRNTTIVRSNYLLTPNARLYEWSMKLWEGLSHELNYNVMFSQRGVLNLAHSTSQLDSLVRRGNAMRLNGIDAELLSVPQITNLVPGLDTSQNTRFPIHGGLFQPRGGTVRHDAVAWGYARAADKLGVDIIQNCEVSGFMFEGNQVVGVQTAFGGIRADKIGVAVAGHTSQLMKLAGVDHLPMESHALQAFITEPVKPLINTVVTFGAGHLYLSQSNHGGLVFGGDLEGYVSYSTRGDLPILGDVAECVLTMFPNLSRLRLMRQWSGIVDMSMDGSPIITIGPRDGMFLNCGWCYGGFKATPAVGRCFASTIANERPHELTKDFTLDRFTSGDVFDEKGVGPVPHLH